MHNNKKERRVNIKDNEQNTSFKFPMPSAANIVSIVIALICMITVHYVSAQRGNNKPTTAEIFSVWGVTAFMLILIAANILLYLTDAQKKRNTEKELSSQKRFPIGLLNELSQPAAMFDKNGTVVWGNSTFRKKTPRDILISPEKYKFLSLFSPIAFSASGEDTGAPSLSEPNVSQILEYMADSGSSLSVYGAEPNRADKTGATVKPDRSKRTYRSNRLGLEGDWVLHAYRHNSAGSTFYLVVMTDETDLNASKKQYDDDTPMCAYIVIDNLEELVSREQESYRKASANVDSIIKGWASELGAIIKEYERDKYVMLFRREKLSEIIDSDFSILKSVKDVKIGSEEFPVTVSIGISKPTGSLLEKERSAHTAIDTALKRGGSQAIVYLSDTEFKSYGGKDEYKPQMHSGVHTRVFADKLLHELTRCDNVIIMGHKSPDFDSIGSCAGIARLALAYKKNVHLIINENDVAMSEAIARLKTLPEYDLLFKDYMSGMDKLPLNSILICCDANNLKQFESSALVTLADKLFIIDHHRKNEFTPTLSREMQEAGLIKHEFLIIPSASSASELVAEILEHSLPVDHKLTPEEADIMFAGMLLDTKQFTRNTQPATFSAALYLRSCGADPTRAQALFKTELDDYRIESGFGTDVFLERDCIAIAREDSSDVSPTKRIAAAKTADRLLNVKNIRASFAVARLGEDIFISARSDGSINVQLIMEALGGGGHYNAAATMIKNTAVDAAITRLCLEIRRYFGEYDASQPPTKAALKEIYALINKRKNLKNGDHDKNGTAN